MFCFHCVHPGGNNKEYFRFYKAIGKNIKYKYKMAEPSVPKKYYAVLEFQNTFWK